MKKLFILCLLAVVPQIVVGSNTIENSIGLKSEAVIRNDLRQLGITAKTVTMKGNSAHVKATVQGRPVVMDIDRQTNYTRLISADARTTQILKQKLHRSLLKPAIIKPVIPVKPILINPRAPVIHKP